MLFLFLLITATAKRQALRWLMGILLHYLELLYFRESITLSGSTDINKSSHQLNAPWKMKFNVSFWSCVVNDNCWFAVQWMLQLIFLIFFPPTAFGDLKQSLQDFWVSTVCCSGQPRGLHYRRLTDLGYIVFLRTLQITIMLSSTLWPLTLPRGWTQMSQTMASALIFTRWSQSTQLSKCRKRMLWRVQKTVFKVPWGVFLGFIHMPTTSSMTTAAACCATPPSVVRFVDLWLPFVATMELTSYFHSLKYPFTTWCILDQTKPNLHCLHTGFTVHTTIYKAQMTLM